MKMTEENFKAFRKDFAEAMKALNEKYAVDVHLKSIRYSTNDFNAKIEVINRTENGQSVNPMIKKLEEAFVNYAFRYNLEGCLGAEFSHRGAKYKVIGMKPRSKQQPIVVECLADGAKYKYPAGWVQDALGIERTPDDCF